MGKHSFRLNLKFFSPFLPVVYFAIRNIRTSGLHRRSLPAAAQAF